MRKLRLQSRDRRKFSLIPQVSSGVCIFVSSLVLIGWQYRLNELKTLVGQTLIVAPNTALLFILSGVSLLLLGREVRSSPAIVIGRLLALCVAVFALLTLWEYLAGADFGIDGVVFHSRVQDWPIGGPAGRFALQTALAFSFAGLSLLLLDARVARVPISDILTAFLVLLSFAAILGYSYSVQSLHGVMSLETTLLFCVLSAGLMFARPYAGASRLLVSAGPGGYAARNLLLAVIVVLTTFGWIKLELQRAGFIEREFGTALLVAGSVIVVAMLILWTARALDSFEVARDAASAALAANVAEKQATEDRLNEGLAAAGAGIWDTNLKTGAVYWSRAHFTLLGYVVNEVQPSMTTWQQRIHPTDLPRAVQAWDQSIRNRAAFFCEYRVIWPDGTIHWMESKGKVISDEQGDPVRSIGGLVEITDRKRSEQALMEAEKLAVTGRMAATLAHEINNPLAAITNLIYLLKTEHQSNSASNNYLNIADEEIRRVAQLVQKTLSFYRDDSQPAQTDVAEMLSDIEWLYQQRIRSGRIEVVRHVEGDSTVVCNRGEVRQVLTNILVNAIDALDAGGKILLHVYRTHDWSTGKINGIRVSVADSGPGIPPNIRRQLFKPFFSTKGDRGTGLGLWISKGIMEKNGGSIRFHTRSAAPSGTCFSVFIPDLSAAQADPQVLPRTIGQASSGTA